MDNQLLDLISSLSKAEEPEVVWRHVSDLLSKLGFETVNYGIIDTKTSTAIGFYSTMSADWMTHYLDNRYDQNDPWIHHLLKSDQPVFHSQNGVSHLSTSNNETGKKLLAECSEAGLTSSMMIPFHNPLSSVLSGINIGSNIDENEYQARFSEHRTLVVTATALLNSYLSGSLDLLKKEAIKKSTNSGQSEWYPVSPEDNTPILSSREREVLQWLAAGKRTDRIAEKMGVAAVTVNFHLNTIKRKLGVRTREQALVSAIRMGEIDP